MKNLLLCCLAATLAVSSCRKTGIRQTLEKAGENRRELETVLEHYKDEPLKEKATRFLLENMDGHFAHTGEAVDVRQLHGQCVPPLQRRPCVLDHEIRYYLANEQAWIWN